MSIRAASVTRLGYRALAALITVVLVFGNVRLYASDPSTSDLVARLEFLRQELRGGSAERMQDLFPEGYAFSYALYGLTWTNLARTDDSLRERALDEARWALRKLESPAGKAVFDAALTPRYGVFHAGWSTLLRGRVVRLAGPDAPEAGRFAADVEELATAFRTDGPFLEAYPGQAWPVDSVVAIAAVRLHDSVSDEPRYDGLIHRWLRQVEQRLDPETGLLPHRVEPFESGARASSQALIQRFLPLIDPDRAGSRYERFRDRFVTSRASLPGVLEYPTGTDGAGDVDSGPLILGVSASATVVTIGAAPANGRRAHRTRRGHRDAGHLRRWKALRVRSAADRGRVPRLGRVRTDGRTARCGPRDRNTGLVAVALARHRGRTARPALVAGRTRCQPYSSNASDVMTAATLGK